MAVESVVLTTPETGPEAPSAPAPETPAVPEKFMKDGKPDFAALAAAYGELEKKLGGTKPVESGDNTEAPEQTPEQKAAEEAAAAAEKAAEAALSVAGVDVKAFSEEFAKDGKLSQASYDALEKAGFSKAVVDTYIRGQQAAAADSSFATAEIASVMQIAGGEEGYKALGEWAVQNVPQAELEAYNAIMDKGDKATVSMAVAGLKARMDAATGSEPRVHIGGGKAPAADVYRSNEEMVAAMKDPRYGKDPAYTKDVEQKVMRSPLG
jgi:hypothetical protein